MCSCGMVGAIKCHDRKKVVSSNASRDMPGGARQKATGDTNTFCEQRPETVKSEVGDDGSARNSAAV